MDDKAKPATGSASPTLPGPSSRTALLSCWDQLTRRTLPAMARAERWPVRVGQGFMRVCLDTAIGRRWDEVVPGPPLRHLTNDQLSEAVRMAEAIVADPAALPRLNATSLRMRGKL